MIIWRRKTDRSPSLTSSDSPVIDPESLPLHIAVIMDGNGRWATKKGLPRVMGHREGVKATKRLVQNALKHGIRYLTIYSFSMENWSRPEDEVSAIMGLFEESLERELPELDAAGVCIRALGDLSRVPESTRLAFQSAYNKTRLNEGLYLSVAVSYGGRAEIVHAAQALARKASFGEIAASSIDEELLAEHLYLPELPEVDLIIRTSGEQRISNFLLWQSAYAEFWFTDDLWPDFGEEHLLKAIADYQARRRRFGGV